MRGIVMHVPSSTGLGFDLVKDEYNLRPEDRCIDLFTALYEPEPRFESDTDSAWRRTMQAILESASYEKFHETTVLDHELSGVAVLPMLEEAQKLYERFRELEDQFEDPVQHELQRQLVEAEAVAIASRAVQEGERAAQTVQALRYMGYGDGAGRFVALHIGDRVLEEAAALVRRVAHMYGRMLESMRITAQSVRRAVTIRGVTLGGDLHRALPSQLAWLSDADTEDLFLLKWLERRLLIRELSGAGARQRGDVVVCVDESGSMKGGNVELAKAYAFALRTYLQPQNRRCHILSFSYEERDMRELPPHADSESVVAWLRTFIGGGTNFSHPLRRAMQLCSGNSDILIITDGDAPLDEDFKRQFLQWKSATGARLFMLHIGVESPLRDIADHVFELGDVTSVVRNL